MILIVGATGHLGGSVTRRLLQAGKRVRILVRPHANSEALAAQGLAVSAQALVASGAEPVEGDLKDPQSLRRACAGVQAVVTTANSAGRSGDDNVESVDLEGNRNLIDAARAAGVERFVFVSALGAHPQSPVPFLAAKGEAETHLKESGMDYTIIAPDAFMDIWIALLVGMPALAGQPVHVAGSGDRKHSFVAREDVAQFVVAALQHPSAVRQTLTIGGPDALSFRDAADVYARVLGRTVPVVSIPPGQPIPGLPDSVVGIAAGFDQYDSVLEMDDLARAYGVPLTSLETFVRGHVAAAPAA